MIAIHLYTSSHISIGPLSFSLLLQMASDGDQKKADRLSQFKRCLSTSNMFDAKGQLDDIGRMFFEKWKSATEYIKEVLGEGVVATDKYKYAKRTDTRIEVGENTINQAYFEAFVELDLGEDPIVFAIIRPAEVWGLGSLLVAIEDDTLDEPPAV